MFLVFLLFFVFLCYVTVNVVFVDKNSFVLYMCGVGIVLFSLFGFFLNVSFKISGVLCWGFIHCLIIIVIYGGFSTFGPQIKKERKIKFILESRLYYTRCPGLFLHARILYWLGILFLLCLFLLVFVFVSWCILFV